ncbi:MAG: thiamine pyrophosphate-dependent enzyme, partial [Dehalococcoidia bacterium]
PEEIGTNVPTEVALIGDGQAVMAQINRALDENPWQYPPETVWRSGISNRIEENRLTTLQMAHDDTAPMNYYRALRDIRDMMPRDAILASEGASTMDIGRQVLPNFDARTRLDAGTYGTMGVGLGFAIAAAVTNPGRRIICLEGDSAFGFSGMEVETACRHKLPITFIILNNNGIGGGPDELPTDRPYPPGAYTPDARYERVIEAFGGQGFYVSDPAELRPALQKALESPMPTIVNVDISNRAARKPQAFTWHTT